MHAVHFINNEKETGTHFINNEKGEKIWACLGKKNLSKYIARQLQNQAIDVIIGYKINLKERRISHVNHACGSHMRISRAGNHTLEFIIQRCYCD